MERILRVGIVGSGGIAQSVHIPNYQKCHGKVQVMAVADVAVNRAKEAADRFWDSTLLCQCRRDVTVG
jgi:predicted dehydrogenase